MTEADLFLDTGDTSDELLDIFHCAGDMAGTGSPLIKDEPDDFFHPHHSRMMPNNHQAGFGMPQSHSFDQFSSSHGDTASIDPSELSMPNGSFMQSYPFNPPQSLGFEMGSAGIADDELVDLGNLDEPNNQQGHFAQPLQDFGAHDAAFSPHSQSLGAAVNQHAQPHQLFSHTPDGAPMNSPFHQNQFSYDHFRPPPHPQHRMSMGTPSPYNVSPGMRSGAHSASLDQGYVIGKPKARQHSGLDRKTSESRSPLTPKTPALGNLNLGTPDSGTFPSQPIHTSRLGAQRHQKSLSNQWDGTPGSMQSYVDSPISSPGQPSHHAQISDIMKTGKPASLPAKVENGHHIGPVPTYQTQEAKRRRRRESHNMVERRRRDNINERIQELSHLVPHHRLEDEKVRKHLLNNSPLSPTLGATSMSPPQATSLLAGGAGRRAAGNITTGIPIEEKDKGPNKGDILNGAVGWTRDLMWQLHAKLQQESELADYITSLGGTFPFEQTEDEKRMRSELADAMEKNDPTTFSYSRAAGSGLRVPKHTTLSGESLLSAIMSPQSLSPANLSGGDNSGNVSVGGANGNPQNNFWSGHNSGGSGHGSISFKEEDEYGMDLG